MTQPRVLFPLLFAVVLAVWFSRGAPAAALYITVASYAAYRFARSEWGKREGAIAAGLLAYFLCLAEASSELLLIVPHLMAVHYAWRGRPWLSGLWCGAGLLLHAKAILLAAVCGFWLHRFLPAFGAAVLAPQLLQWPGVRELWQPLLPWRESLAQTGRWLAGQLAPLLAGAWFLRQGPGRPRWLLWLSVSLAAVAAGALFPPYSFFPVLPVVVLLASRGFVLLPRRWAVAISLLLVIPLLPF